MYCCVVCSSDVFSVDEDFYANFTGDTWKTGEWEVFQDLEIRAALPMYRTYSIGKSVNGMPLNVTEIGTGTKVGLVVAGALHGNEFNTKTLVRALEKLFSAHPALVPPHCRLFFIPEINPEGIKKKMRKNGHLVDLNRNFPTDDWKSDAISPSRMVPGSGGPSPGSEPEVQALTQWLLNVVKPSVEQVYIISFHAAYPPVGSVQPGYLVYGEPGLESARFAQFIAQESGYTYLKTWTTKIAITGEFIHWCEMNDIWSCDIELPDYYDPMSLSGNRIKTTFEIYERTIVSILVNYFVSTQ